MRVEIYEHLDKKGVGNNDLFKAIPIGKKGTSYSFNVDEGKVTFQFHSNIRDAELKVAIVLLSYTYNQMGKDLIDKFRNGIQLPVVNEKTGQTLYTDPITIDAKELSELIYCGDRKKGKRVFTHLQHLEDLAIRYELTGLNSTVRLFDNVAYNNGKITFNIANILINRLKDNMLAFRLPPVLEHNGLAMRLSMYVESHQRPGGKYTDTSGEKRTKYYPMNEYYLDDLVTALQLQNQRSDKVISTLQDAFTILSNSTKNTIPKFTYNKYRRSFENEYKNGKK